MPPGSQPKILEFPSRWMTANRTMHCPVIAIRIFLPIDDEVNCINVPSFVNSVINVSDKSFLLRKKWSVKFELRGTAPTKSGDVKHTIPPFVCI